MSDLMFYGVLRMPYEMAMGNELSRLQFYSRAKEAADRVEQAEERLAVTESALTTTRKLLAAYERGEVPPADPKMLYYVDQAWLDAAPVENAAGALLAVDTLRAAGRAEALQILMGLSPEGGIDAYTGWSRPVGPEDEGDAYWDEEKLRELFAVDGVLADMMDKAEGEYHHYSGLRDEAEHAKNFAANMHSSGKVREVLSRAGEFDLIAQLCGTDQPTSAADSEDAALLRVPNEAMLNAARDWSCNKYGIGIGTDAAIGCWQAMYDAARTKKAAS